MRPERLGQVLRRDLTLSSINHKVGQTERDQLLASHLLTTVLPTQWLGPLCISYHCTEK